MQFSPDFYNFLLSHIGINIRMFSSILFSDTSLCVLTVMCGGNSYIRTLLVANLWCLIFQYLLYLCDGNTQVS
jgi:hypothetical protein